MDEQDVYVDLFFLINFSMDFLSFFLTAKILHRRLSLWRTLLAAVLGGAYACAALFWQSAGEGAFLSDVAVCFLMSFIALWGKRSSAGATAGFAAFYALVSMALGGVMTGLYSLLNRLHLPLDQIGEDDISVWVLFLLALAAGIATSLGATGAGTRAGERECFLHLKLWGARLRSAPRWIPAILSAIP